MLSISCLACLARNFAGAFINGDEGYFSLYIAYPSGPVQYLYLG